EDPGVSEVPDVIIEIEDPELPKGTGTIEVPEKDQLDGLDEVPKTGDVGAFNSWFLLALAFLGLIPKKSDD
ncbi:MAG: hypothetical protein GX366_05495, partial [Epulopiscium sp.]|nr:hypothetical protein [Candidatus Epulonipiscium sp.]